MDKSASVLEELYQMYQEGLFNKINLEERELAEEPTPYEENLKLVEDGNQLNLKYNPTLYKPYSVSKIESLKQFIIRLDHFYQSDLSLRPSLGRILNHLDDQSTFSTLVAEGDNEKLTLYSENKFPSPNEAKLLDLLSLLKEEPALDLTIKTYTSEEISSFFTTIFQDLNLPIEIRISSRSKAKISINPSRGILTIRDNIVMSELDLKRLLVHEIGVHYQRFKNGLTQKDPFLSLGLGFDYLYYEEGLAVYMEEKYNLLDVKTFNKYILRAISTNLTSIYDFSDLYAYLRNHLSAEDAFDMTARVKRYSSDTSRLGGFTKDVVYYDGYLLVKDYLLNDPDALDQFFAGKVSPSEFHLLSHPAIGYLTFIDTLLKSAEAHFKNII